MNYQSILRKTSALVVVLFTASSGDVWACEVCYGAAESPIIDGMNMSVLFMLGMTYSLIVGAGLSFFLIRRRALHLAKTVFLEGARRSRAGGTRTVPFIRGWEIKNVACWHTSETSDLYKANILDDEIMSRVGVLICFGNDLS